MPGDRVRHTFAAGQPGSDEMEGVRGVAGRARRNGSINPGLRKATKAIAERLQISPGDEVMRTEYRFFADDLPSMLSTSHEPLVITQGTSIEQPEAGHITGVVPRMDAIGVHITNVTEDVYGRAPRPFEADTLAIPQGLSVLAIERTYYAELKPVETADIVVPADRYALSYTLRIPDK